MGRRAFRYYRMCKEQCLPSTKRGFVLDREGLWQTTEGSTTGETDHVVVAQRSAEADEHE